MAALALGGLGEGLIAALEIANRAKNTEINEKYRQDQAELMKANIAKINFENQLWQQLMQDAMGGGQPAGNPAAPAKDPALGKPINIRPGQQPPDVYSQIYDFYKSKGMPHNAILGILGNIKHESGGRPDVPGDNGNSFGLFQFNGPRREQYFQFAKQTGKDPNDPMTQVEFSWNEMSGTEKAAYERAVGAKSPEEAALLWSQNYFRAGNPMNDKRTAYATEFGQRFGQPTGGTDAFGKTVEKIEKEGVTYGSGRASQVFPMEWDKSQDNCGGFTTCAINAKLKELGQTKLLPTNNLGVGQAKFLSQQYGSQLLQSGNLTPDAIKQMGAGTVISGTRDNGVTHAEIVMKHPQTGELVVASYGIPGKSIQFKPIDETYVANINRGRFDLTNPFSKIQGGTETMVAGPAAPETGQPGTTPAREYARQVLPDQPTGVQPQQINEKKEFARRVLYKKFFGIDINKDDEIKPTQIGDSTVLIDKKGTVKGWINHQPKTEKKEVYENGRYVLKDVPVPTRYYSGDKPGYYNGDQYLSPQAASSPQGMLNPAKVSEPVYTKPSSTEEVTEKADKLREELKQGVPTMEGEKQGREDVGKQVVGGVPANEAGKYTDVVNAKKRAQEATALLFDENGNLKRSILTTGRIPGGDYAMLRSKMQQAIEMVLRARTGAAANPGEVTGHMNQYMPGMTDNQETARQKINDFNQWIAGQAAAIDPTGKRLAAIEKAMGETPKVGGGKTTKEGGGVEFSDAIKQQISNAPEGKPFKIPGQTGVYKREGDKIIRIQ